MQFLFVNLNLLKVSGFDFILNWLFKEYVDFFCCLLIVIFNVFFKEQCLFQIWKMVDVILLLKMKLVKEFKKDLWFILLIVCLLKVVEECVVVDYVKFVVFRVFDFNQYGVVFNLFIIQVLIYMVYYWLKEIDGNGVIVRIVFFDYCKVFDLIDYNIFVYKFIKFDLLNSVINWIIDFLSDCL